MKLFNYYAKKKLNDLKREGIRVLFAGDRSKLSEEVRKSMETAENHTKDCNEMTLIACFNYGGKQEIIDAVNKAIEKGHTVISEEDIRENLYLPDVPDPDLIVRTSGELRLSNFWLWESAYSEFYFTNALWPDFNETLLDKALKSYMERDRRYGGIKKV